MSRAWIALGGNQGNVVETFAQAMRLLDPTPGIRVSRISGHYTTSPVGAHSGNEFLNAAAELQTTLPPLELLQHLQAVETALGRIRTIRWGPRTLDLDLLFYDDLIFLNPVLTVPHPHAWYRRFVLDPLREIAPDLLHPVLGFTIQQLCDRLSQRPLPCTLTGSSESERNDLKTQIERAFPAVQILASANGQEALNFWLGPPPRRPSQPGTPWIDITASPTPKWETIRDALTAALDECRMKE